MLSRSVARSEGRCGSAPKQFDRVQILTAFEIIEGAQFDSPARMHAVKRLGEAKMELRV